MTRSVLSEKCEQSDKSVNKSDTASPRGFRFKQFFVADGDCAMKVGTDGILLGSWATLPAQGGILDIGCGSGLISLMLAQRTQDRLLSLPVTGVELDSGASHQARENITNSPWHPRMNIVHQDISAFDPGHEFSLIVSNPPYFVHGQSFDDQRRAQARHTGSLDFATLLRQAARLLTDDGRFSVILPYQEGLGFIELAGSMDWFCHQQCRVKTTPRKDYHRLLITLGRQPGGCDIAELVIHDPTGGYSEDYIRLTRDFYLKM